MGPKFELRVSFPVVTSGEQYGLALDRLKEGIVPAPDRQDAYFVTPPHYGLKHRSQENLELKVRKPSSESDFEFWSKFALANEDVAQCGEEIATILTAEGHPTSAADLVHHEKVTLSKGVCKREFEKVNFEVTRITAVDETGNNRPCSAREWISVVIEGKKDKHVRKFLSEAPEVNALKAAIRTVEEEGTVRPVVAGYPMFVRQLIGVATTEDHAELHASWRKLVAMINER